MDAQIERQRLRQTAPAPPAWAADASWYHVFVPRFCNGHAENDAAYTVPWTRDWSGLADHESPPLETAMHLRRYGGDLQGLAGKLGYLKDLGVNALYLSPVFQAESQHKYDASDYRHVDDTLGIKAVASLTDEETLDPHTWQWTQSDRVFLRLLDLAHADGIRVVIDGVFNHVGQQFWAWRDVLARGRLSPYAEWFDVTAFEPELQWNGWDGPNGSLIRFKRFGDAFHPDVERHLFDITRRWMDPNGDGDPSDGVDGWRLDAAEQVPLGFWKRWRKHVKSINPNALVVGEIWTDARKWLTGDAFDVVSNYPFAAPAVEFFRHGNRPQKATAFARELAGVRRRHGSAVNRAMWNLLSSHDTPRVVSMLADQFAGYTRPNQTPPSQQPATVSTPPSEDAYHRQALAAVMQFTYVGAPMIFYGDEIGMFGGDDPYCRGPMWWDGDQSNNNQSNGGSYDETGPWRRRTDLWCHYKTLFHLRRRLEALRRGTFRLLLADDARRVLAYARRFGRQRVVIIVNADTSDHDVRVQMGQPGQRYRSVVLGLGEPDAARAAALAQALAGPADDWLAAFGSVSHPVSAGADGMVRITCPALRAVLILVAPQANGAKARAGRAM